MNERDQKTLRRVRWEGKVQERREGRYERASTFRSPKDYQRKSKYRPNYMEDMDE